MPFHSVSLCRHNLPQSMNTFFVRSSQARCKTIFFVYFIGTSIPSLRGSVLAWSTWTKPPIKTVARLMCPDVIVTLPLGGRRCRVELCPSSAQSRNLNVVSLWSYLSSLQSWMHKAKFETPRSGHVNTMNAVRFRMIREDDTTVEVGQMIEHVRPRFVRVYDRPKKPLLAFIIEIAIVASIHKQE